MVTESQRVQLIRLDESLDQEWEGLRAVLAEANQFLIGELQAASDISEEQLEAREIELEEVCVHLARAWDLAHWAIHAADMGNSRARARYRSGFLQEVGEAAAQLREAQQGEFAERLIGHFTRASLAFRRLKALLEKCGLDHQLTVGMDSDVEILTGHLEERGALAADGNIIPLAASQRRLKKTGQRRECP